MTSRRIASAVFFLVRLRLVLGRSQTADRGVGFHKLATQLLEFAELRHLALGLANGRRSGQGFGGGFAIDFIGESEMGAMSGLPGLMAATAWLATPTRGVRDATGAQVAKLSDLLSYHLTPLC